MHGQDQGAQARARALGIGVARDHEFLAQAALELDPVRTAPRGIGAAAPLADHALQAQLAGGGRSEEHTSELQSPCNLVCRLLLEKKKTKNEHQRDDRRGDNNGASDVACRCMSFTGQNANVFKSAQSAYCQFAEDLEAVEELRRGRSDFKRAIRAEIAASETNDWKNNQSPISQEHRVSPDVVHPFA